MICLGLTLLPSPSVLLTRVSDSMALFGNSESQRAATVTTTTVQKEKRGLRTAFLAAHIVIVRAGAVVPRTAFAVAVAGSPKRACKQRLLYNSWPLESLPLRVGPAVPSVFLS